MGYNEVIQFIYTVFVMWLLLETSIFSLVWETSGSYR